MATSKKPAAAAPAADEAPAAPKAKAEPKHSSGLSAEARAKVVKLIDEWEDSSNRSLPFVEHLRAKLADES